MRSLHNLLQMVLLLFVLLVTPISAQETLSTVAEASETSVKPPFRPYTLLNSEEIHSTLLQWKTQYSDFIQINTAQETFGLATAGTDINLDCPFDTGVEGCLNYYAVMTDQVAHPPNSQSWKRLPTVLLSGELHGNERVGPTTVMETTRLILEAATCESQLDQSDCTAKLQIEYGMTLPQQQWLAQLLRSRRIMVVPTANALGYFRNSRMEGNVDPNRDFPYDQLADNSDRCMQSIAARVMNELFRHYLIMNSFTFHGGTELLGYEWGGPSHFGGVSPDDIAQDQLARSYATYGGGFEGSNGRNHPQYLYGDMNSIIYYVRGGFEDFAYAGSWDKEHMIQCEPTTYGGYPVSKTRYEDGMLRSFNMLVETSYMKTPNENDLGTTWHVLNKNSGGDAPTDYFRQRKLTKRRNLRGGTYWAYTMPRDEPIDRMANGHVPRNIRLALASIDMVQPYLSITKINQLTMGNNAALPPKMPSSHHTHSVCSSRKLVIDDVQRITERAIETRALPLIHVAIGNNSDVGSPIRLEWTAGGAMTMDHTYLWIAGVGSAVEATGFIGDAVPLADASSWVDEYICGDPFTEELSLAQRLEPNRIKQTFQSLGNPQQGSGFFSPNGNVPKSDDSGVMGPAFSAEVNLQALNVHAGSMLVVIASTRVDSEWAELPMDAPVSPKNTGPQSHMVQSRSNSSWVFENSQGHIIQGQTEFFSRPVLIQIVASIDTAGANGTATLVNDRYQETPSVPDGDVVVSKTEAEEDQKDARLVTDNTMAPTHTGAPTRTEAPTDGATFYETTEWTEAPTLNAEGISLGTLAPTRIAAGEEKSARVPPPDVLSSFVDVPRVSTRAVGAFKFGEKKNEEGENKRRHLENPILEENESYVKRRATRLQRHIPQERP